MEEFIFQIDRRSQSWNFTEDWGPLRKFFKSVSRIIGRPNSSRIEGLKVLRRKLKNPKTLKKCWKNLQPQMPEP